jgi:glycosyltransferase involved in cell wall biosynthesis
VVIVSNGFNKFHLTSAAAELDQIGMLSLLITGAYPGRWVKTVGRYSCMDKYLKFQRLLARRDDVDDRKVKSLWLPEAIQSTARLSSRLADSKAGLGLHLCAFSLYGSLAARLIRSADGQAQIYHYRAGFGGKSVNAAKSRGMVTLCDHASAHPALHTYLVDNSGALPSPQVVCTANRFERWLLEDIERADAVLVNSDFARETFVNRSWSSSPIHVIYWGVDNQFMQYKHYAGGVSRKNSVPLRLLFAGFLERRKGAELLVTALKADDGANWRLEIIGPVHPAIAVRHRHFLGSRRVTCSGLLPRSEVAVRMQAADVFVSPSLSEGSARVIFEAMACGCYIITTSNSGSIVKDGVHGALVSPNDPDSLIKAIHWAANHRREVEEIGRNNACFIRREYSQRHYREKLVRLYHRLLQH